MIKVLFKEEQGFMKPKIWLILAPVWGSVMILLLIGLYRQLYLGEPWGDDPMPDSGLITLFFVVVLAMAVSIFLMAKSRLIVEIRDNGLWYRYPPFLSRFRQISREAIERYEVRQYSAIREYGGYGIRKRRLNLRNRGDAYITGGNTGLQLYLVDGKKVLFSTQRKEAILYAMEKMMTKEQ
ncbi:MAG: hypothetical protein JXA03_12390 [Bacteroidales bacterium]|nr:hypothetical protein [Bacteroidales bacterium]